MTKKILEKDEPNPYNAKKDWHEVEDKPFVSSNSLYFEEPSEKNKLFDSDDINDIKAEGSVNVEELEVKEDKPYKRPDYKKRYEEFKKQYPDVYEVVETVAHLQSESKAKVLEERLGKLQAREQELLRKDAEKRLNERHPDFEDIRNSDDFHDWAKEQPESIQSWIYSNADDADLASRAIDLFKKDKGIDLPKTKKSSSRAKTNAADMISTKTTSVEPKQQKVWSEREIAALSMAEFDKYEKEISDAMQEGRIIR